MGRAAHLLRIRLKQSHKMGQGERARSESVQRQRPRRHVRKRRERQRSEPHRRHEGCFRPEIVRRQPCMHSHHKEHQQIFRPPHPQHRRHRHGERTEPPAHQQEADGERQRGETVRPGLQQRQVRTDKSDMHRRHDRQEGSLLIYPEIHPHPTRSGYTALQRSAGIRSASRLTRHLPHTGVGRASDEVLREQSSGRSHTR